MEKNKMQPEETHRYPMTKDQLSQIDCRIRNCKFYKGSGTCANVSPAITLNEDGKFVCWSKIEVNNREESVSN